MTVGIKVRHVLWYAIIVVLSFALHGQLKEQYHMRCNKDILQVLFFRNSHFCQLMYQALTIIEGGYMDFTSGILKFLYPI